MSLHDRCRDFLTQFRENAIMRQGSPVDDLVAFVIAEKGRAADPRLEDSLPLCLYFKDAKDRDEFVALVREANQDMIAKRMP